MKFSCVFVIFPYGILGQVWYKMYLSLSISNICLLPYFEIFKELSDVILSVPFILSNVTRIGLYPLQSTGSTHETYPKMTEKS